MNGLLLDTHTFLWSLIADEKLSEKAKVLISNPEIPVYVSSVTFWEISLKSALGKLTLSPHTPEDLPAIAEHTMGFLTLPLEVEEAARFYHLPILHKDPFDRMLIWQAISRRLTLVTKDCQFSAYTQYGLSMIW
ncbi:hypothetical protein TI05_05315 [Achromatium sp. WMS3]|nr:hypothetical protein TI05_05315 [Achromatium sp. WMS3]